MADSYDIILLNPPWRYTGSASKWGAAEKFYETMVDDDIFSLDLPLADPGIVFLWATCPRLDSALECFKHWGLFYRGVAFVWVKTKTDGTPIGAQGVRPSIVKPLTELVVVGSTARNGRPIKLASESVCQTIFTPKREHSRKPEEVRERIDALYPNASKLEMFSRGPSRLGWDLHGEELGMFENCNDIVTQIA